MLWEEDGAGGGKGWSQGFTPTDFVELGIELRLEAAEHGELDPSSEGDNTCIGLVSKGPDDSNGGEQSIRTRVEPSPPSDVGCSASNAAPKNTTALQYALKRVNHRKYAWVRG